MKRLFYTNYHTGRSGFSNGVMSIECGAVLAHLTGRTLVLDGNISPPANIVGYGGRVSNERPSRVTDLIDLPVPWEEPRPGEDRAAYAGPELTSHSLWDVAIAFPSSMDLASADARSFAHTRTRWVTITDAHERAPVLRVSEDPIAPGTDAPRRNLAYYSYLFYLDAEARRSVYGMLARMQPKEPLRALAARVARDLGRFNAVHLRRGDFKQTLGMTTLERTPAEAIEALEPHFRRDDLLVIVTDEREDPFFRAIEAAYPHHVYVDHHILDEYGDDFAALPHKDSLALACLSQLVAAESADFIGSMRSTFSGLIHRYRGSRGRTERFKFLWNELPGDGDPLVRGRQRKSDALRLERGEMVEEHAGPYSWNRYSHRIQPAWMREWPESFLMPDVLATGELPRLPPGAASRAAPPEPRRIDVRIQLVGGHSHALTLREDAPELVQLFEAIASPEPRRGFAQLPADEGRTAISFPVSHLVSIATTPPVLVGAPPRSAGAQPPTRQVVSGPTRPPRCVILDDFLSPEEHRELLAYALACEEDFEAGTITSKVDGYRKNRVVLEFGASDHSKMLQNRLLIWLPLVARALGAPMFPLELIESQLTAGNDGDFFRAHTDSGGDGAARGRRLSCVYMFYREPKGFAGGELRLFDVRDVDGRVTPAETFQLVEPRSNRMVVFLSDHVHEVLPIRCPSRAFADSRFAVTTWLWQAAAPKPDARFGWGHFRCGVVAPQLAGTGSAAKGRA